MNVNRQAMLDTIAHSEGTSTNVLTKNDGYDVLVTGIDLKTGLTTPEIFTDYSQHPFMTRPAKIINRNGLDSTASGRYQILLRFWLVEAAQQGYPSFEPVYQDLYVIQQFRERRGLLYLDAGNFPMAVQAVSGLWASLPGKAYLGQTQHSMAALVAIYQAKGGLLTAPPMVTA